MSIEGTTTATAPAAPAEPGDHRIVDAVDLWLDSLGGAEPGDGVWWARLRGLALAGAAVTLPMSAWKAIGPLTASDLFLAAAVLLLLPRVHVADARTLWIPAVAAALIALGGTIGTLVTGASISGSADALIPFVASSFGAFVLIVCWRPGLPQLRSFAWLWVAGGVISALVALIIPDLHMFLRPSGLTPQSNHLAIISVILLGVTLGVIASDPRRNRLLLGLAAASILFAAIVASGSRARLAAALVVVLLALIATRNRFTVAIALGVVIAGLALVAAGVAGDDNALTRLTGDTETSAESDADREARNDAAWERFKSDPITGVGFDDVTDAHNFFLQVGSGAGILGIAGGIMILLLAFRSYLIAVWKRMAENPPYWAMAAGLAAAVIGYLAASMFQNVLWDRNIWIAIALMTWAAASTVGRDPAPPRSEPS
jgi:O-antigen ligase